MEDQNKIDWKQYEFITKYIYETLGGYNINIEGWGKDCKIKGKSGINHQIDVLTSETDHTGTFRTAIECKYWNKKVNKDIVMKLLETINDSDIERGIIVSKSGYTPDAEQYAKHRNILIIQLREAGKEYTKQQKELQIADLAINYQIKVSRPVVTNIVVTDINDKIITLHERDEYHIFIEDVSGKKSKLFDDIMLFREYLQEQKSFVTVTKKHVHQYSLLHLPSNIKKIKNITYTGLLTVSDNNQNKVFSIVDRVWLVMEKIFEKQTFIVSKGGLIMLTSDKY
jgi:hypothetical protein